jgi:2-polyprenyl-6-methoxyphenol hydroxylase-like FAD-dependent oxidoreductase
MANPIQTEVLIVGGGPVGLTLAMDVARRGINVILAEVRAAGKPPNVRCNHVSARTMEIFRRLGIVRAVRDAGLPALIIPTMSSFGRRRLVANSRASQFPVALNAIR